MLRNVRPGMCSASAACWALLLALYAFSASARVFVVYVRTVRDGATVDFAMTCSLRRGARVPYTHHVCDEVVNVRPRALVAFACSVRVTVIMRDHVRVCHHAYNVSLCVHVRDIL